MADTHNNKAPAAGAGHVRLFGSLLLVAFCLPMGGCDPIIDIGGAFFPGWLIVVLGGIATVVAVRWGLQRVELEPWLGPRGLVYICMFVCFSIFYWFLFFET